MASTDTHKPYVSAQKILPEITAQGIILAIVLGFLLTAANVYLGLYVGMTVSASIPAAVISMAVLRSLAKANLSNGTNILENNWVQTAVSSGESLAAGVIFTGGQAADRTLLHGERGGVITSSFWRKS